MYTVMQAMNESSRYVYLYKSYTVSMKAYSAICFRDPIECQHWRLEGLFARLRKCVCVLVLVVLSDTYVRHVSWCRYVAVLSDNKQLLTVNQTCHRITSQTDNTKHH